MAVLSKKYVVPIVGFSIISISIVGMIIMKSKIEYQHTSNGELYFSLFRFLFFATVLVFVGDWLFNRWKKYQQLRNEKVLAELSNLKNQVSPHFFFNTLNNLYGLIKKDAGKSREFVLKLSDLMRYSIYSSDADTVPIQEEIDYLENFIALHEIRYFDAVKIEFEKDIQNQALCIAPLLLIILLENAFKHGAEKITGDNAFINLKLKTADNMLAFTIENNYDPNTVEEGEGLGLKNLKKRLQLAYPKKHTFKTFREENLYRAELVIAL